ncbi:unnamed protein product [Phaedon cochleariae]|uniref:OBP47-like domain-containing protein n=1 Tax=Phaedon cochleariae TaxID=80249 RepID=A0A9P0GX42_PHACE|nr:unnamed protein product [Phaedon cochleariae]
MKIFAEGALLATLVAVIAAYDFQDSEFNQILAGDLEDVYTSALLAHPRVRREENSSSEEEKCRPKRGKSPCCSEEIFKKPSEDDKDVKRVCFKEVTGKEKPEGRPDKHHGHFGGPFDPFNCDKVEQFRKDMICIEQCVGQKQNIIDSDGNLKQENFQKFIKNLLSKQPTLAPIADKVVAGCLEEVKNVTSQAQKADPEAACKPVGIAVRHCLFKQVQLNCPEDQIKDKSSCSKLQERLRKGRDDMHGPRGPAGPGPEDDDK